MGTGAYRYWGDPGILAYRRYCALYCKMVLGVGIALALPSRSVTKEGVNGGCHCVLLGIYGLELIV